MIMLPPGPRRKWLMSFWLAIALASGATVGAIVAFLIAPRWFGLGGIVTLVMAIPGVRRPELASKSYQKWRRWTRGYCHVVTVALTGICFCTVLLSGRLAGSSLRLARPRTARTMWVPRKTMATTAYDQDNRASRASPRSGWIGTYLSWTARSGQIWAAGLLPFLILLDIVEPGQEKTAPPNIYTLF